MFAFSRDTELGSNELYDQRTNLAALMSVDRKFDCTVV